MAKSVSIPVILHTPKTKEGIEQMERQLADVYVDHVITTIHKLDCPAKQKVELLGTVINTISKEQIGKK